MSRSPRLTRAVLTRAAYLFVQGGSSLAVFLLLARVLDGGELGAAAVALSVFVTAQALSDAGLTGLAVIELPAAAALSPDVLERVRSALAQLFLRAALLTLALALAVALAVPSGARAATLLVAPAAAASLVVTGAESIARSQGDLRAPLVFVIAGRLTFFLLAPLLLLGASAEGAIALFAIGTTVGTLPALRALLRARGRSPAALPRPLLRGVAVLGAVTALVTLGTRGAVLVLAHVAGLGEAAVFEAAWRAFQLPLYLVGALATATTPFAAGAVARGGRRALARAVGPGLGLTVAVGVAAAVALYRGSVPIAALVLGEPSADAAATLRVLAIALPLAFTAFYLQTAVLLPLRELRTLVTAAGLLCAVTLVGAGLLGATQGAVGCAVAVTTGQAALLGVLAGGVARQGSAGRSA